MKAQRPPNQRPLSPIRVLTEALGSWLGSRFPSRVKLARRAASSSASPKAKEASILVEIAVIFALIALNALFSGAEIAIISVRRTRMEELASEGSESARAVLVLKDNPEPFLATVQIGITVVGATAAAFGGATVAAQLATLVGRVHLLAPYAKDLSLVAVVAGISYGSVVLGELVPKSLALRAAERYALWVGRPLRLLASLARPFVTLLTWSSNVVLKPFRDRTNFTEAKYSIEELRNMVEEAARSGTVTARAGEIAARALELERLRAQDVMIPRQEVIAVPRRAGGEEVQRILLEHGHTRLPVFEDNLDNVVGYLNVKDILAVAWDPKVFILADLVRPAHFVPESMRALDLLEEMRSLHTPFTIVVDDQGGLAGIVTLEDLVEELVGEILTEHARAAEPSIQKDPDGTAIVAGGTSLHGVNRELGLDLPEGDDYTTVAGLCLAIAGRIPEVGDQLPVPGRAIFEIMDASRKHVRTVRIKPAEKPPPSRQRGAFVSNS